MIRLFYGLSLPDDVRDALCRLQHGLPGVRWLDADTFHITLRFIGEIDEDRARDLDHAMAHRLGRKPVAPIPLQVRGLGCFGEGQRARTIWAGVEPCAPLMALQSVVETVCQSEGLTAEGRSYRPHITLGKTSARVDRARLEMMIAEYTSWTAPAFAADQITLFRSFLGRGGAHYEAVAEIPLTAIPSQPVP